MGTFRRVVIWGFNTRKNVVRVYENIFCFFLTYLSVLILNMSTFKNGHLSDGQLWVVLETEKRW